MLKKLLFLAFSIIPLSSFAVTADSQQWINITAQGLVSETYSIGVYFEAQTRHSEKQNEYYESFLRPAIYYKTEDVGSFFLGTLKRYDSESKEAETRNWVQWSYDLDASDFKNSFRVRLEQRDLNGIEDKSNRVRVMARSLHSTLISETIRPFTSLELFYNFNKVSPDINSGLSQSRASLGLSAVLNSMFTLELSYLNMYSFNMTKEDQVNHALNAVLNIKF